MRTCFGLRFHYLRLARPWSRYTFRLARLVLDKFGRRRVTGVTLVGRSVMSRLVGRPWRVVNARLRVVVPVGFVRIFSVRLRFRTWLLSIMLIN